MSELHTLIETYYAAVNGADWAAFDRCVADGFEHHTPGLPPGREPFKRFLRTYRQGFPDLHSAVQEIIVTPGRAVAYTETSGTHQGTFMGHPATHNAFAAAGIDIFHVADGRIVARRGVFDTISMLQQLGLYRPVQGSVQTG